MIIGAVSLAVLASAVTLIVIEVKRAKRTLDGKPKKKIQVVHDHGETFVQAVVDGKEE
jgi:hypothetical protein